MSPRVALVVLAVAAVLSGCGGQGSQAASRTQYVALGDSYAAAPGIGLPFDREGCYRSPNNYPHLVAKSTGLSLADETCSGANTLAITKSQRTLTGQWRGAQLDSLSSGTRLVTVGIGGNDLGLYGELTRTCILLAAQHPDGSPCQDADAKAPAGQALSARLADLVQRDTFVLRAIKDRAPRAKILVIGYPSIVPDSGPCADFPVAHGDLAYVKRIEVGMNQALMRAAESTGTRYLDIASLTRGHDICSKDPWVAGVRADHGTSVPWHPYAAEQEVVAKAIEAAYGQGGKAN